MHIKQSSLKHSIKKYSIFFYILLALTSISAMEKREYDSKEIELMEYIGRENAPDVEKILAGPVNVNFTFHRYANNTPLCEAAGLGNRDIIKLLLARPEIALDQDGGNGYRALHIAAMHGFSGVAQALCAHGASLQVTNNEGDTPFHKAIEGVHSWVVNTMVATVPKKKIEAIATLRRTVFTFLCCDMRHKNDKLGGMLTMVPRDITVLLCRYIVRVCIEQDQQEFAFGCMRSKGVFTYLIADQLAHLEKVLAIKNNAQKTALDAVWGRFDYATEIKVMLDPIRDALRISFIESYVKKKYNKINLAATAHNSTESHIPPTEDRE